MTDTVEVNQDKLRSVLIAAKGNPSRSRFADRCVSELMEDV